MRKYIIGAIVGSALTFSVSAYGAELSKIGKKVQGEYTVVVDGATLPQKAVGVDGSTYAPLRAIGEELGYNVSFSNKTVTFSAKEVKEPVSTTTPEPTASGTTTPTTQDQISELEKQRDKLTYELLSWPSKYDLSNLTDEQKKEAEEMKRKIDDLQKQIDALKEQLK
ncbi:FlxA-like family protein [Cohnella xylanilytica]|uniref:FlxA-like family protein n=1 Tax=Cohnella xylanilytica TaxID=557555 RepID=A0A841U8E8_9BACL|nr:stalk domain-containing protein [Cohnella xylanilytica]MBB6694374.1 FlxA-like family protein [Cohnella xylanilytica]